ncbi:MAG: hypothetical protein ACRCSL_04860 [Microbacterium sp.]
MDFEKYLTGIDPWWQDALALGGGAAAGVVGTRSIDKLDAGRMHPLALFAVKGLFAIGAGYAVHNAGYPRLATGLTFGAFADSTIRYADQIETRYILPQG